MHGTGSDRPMNGTDVCAVVVTYHPDTAFPLRLNSVCPQVGALVIVDNGSADAERNMLREAASDSKIDVIFNLQNLGLARALNIGVQRAAELGYSWVLLLDQDSRVDPDMVRSLLGIHMAFPDRERLAPEDGEKHPSGAWNARRPHRRSHDGGR